MSLENGNTHTLDVDQASDQASQLKIRVKTHMEEVFLGQKSIRSFAELMAWLTPEQVEILRDQFNHPKE